MSGYRIQDAAGRRIDEIYSYTRDQWGEEQANDYILRLFARFEDIALRRVLWRRIPIELGVDGCYARHEHHYIYWRLLPDGAVGIVTVLHERMHQIAQFRDDSTGQ